jgi:hypothetical protein
MPAMLRQSTVRLALALLWLLPVVGCFDPANGEIGMKITRGEDICNCLVMVFNEKGLQIQEVPTDQLGVVYVKKLVPGVYTFKFKGAEGSMFSAVRTVRIGEGASCYLAVNVDQAKDPKGEAEASSAAGAAPGTGEYNMEP